MIDVSQVGIFILGPTAVLLSQSNNMVSRKWAPVVGLISQPFWLWTSWHAQQWGVFAVSFFYTACWYKGLHLFWLKGQT